MNEKTEATMTEQLDAAGYAVVLVTEFYGPRTERHLHAVSGRRALAEAIAAAYEQTRHHTGLPVLGHGQSSPTRAAVRLAVRLAGDPYGDFGHLPAQIVDALPEIGAGGGDAGDQLDEGLAGLGWEVMRGGKNRWYLVATD